VSKPNAFWQLRIRYVWRAHSNALTKSHKGQPQSINATTAAILDRYVTKQKAIDATKDECWGMSMRTRDHKLKTQMSKNDRYMIKLASFLNISAHAS
jgi:hypothetical protein